MRHQLAGRSKLKHEVSSEFLLSSYSRTEALSAARYRNGVLLVVLTEALRRVGGDPDRLPRAVVDLVVAACGHDRDTFDSLITHCVGRLEIAEDANVKALAPGLREYRGFDLWLPPGADVSPMLAGAAIADRAGARNAPLELVLGGDLRSTVTAAQLADWSQRLRAAIGLPLPDLGGACAGGDRHRRPVRSVVLRVLPGPPARGAGTQRDLLAVAHGDGHRLLDAAGLPQRPRDGGRRHRGGDRRPHRRPRQAGAAPCHGDRENAAAGIRRSPFDSGLKHSSPASRLGESNPRPTHYEAVAQLPQVLHLH